jgi:hypothetical protein
MKLVKFVGLVLLLLATTRLGARGAGPPAPRALSDAVS